MEILMRYKEVLNNFFLSFMILAICIPGISKDNRVESRWIDTAVTIDGSNNEWKGDTLTYEKKVSVDYALRNDSENLYVLFIFKNPKFMSSINKTGMILWFNTEGKKKKKYGIRFQRKMITADAYISLVEKAMGPIPEEKKKEIKLRPRYLVFLNEVIDKKGEASVIRHSPGAPAFNSREGKDVVTYELRIPLKRGEAEPVGIGTEPGKNVKIGFEWGGMTREMKAEMMRRRAETASRGTISSASMEDFEKEETVRSESTPMSLKRVPKKHSFWVEVILAQNQ